MEERNSPMISSFCPNYCDRINAPAVRGRFTDSDSLRAAHRPNNFNKSERIRATTPVGLRITGILQPSSWDVLLIALALAHGLALIVFPSIPLIAIGFWW